MFDAEQRFRALARCPVLRTVPHHQIRLLAAVVEVESFEPGDEIVELGEVSDGVYFVSEGRCGVYPPGAAAPINELTTGELFGEYGIVGMRRTATVRALDRVVVLFLDNDRFRTFLHECPEVMFALLELAASRLVRAMAR